VGTTSGRVAHDVVEFSTQPGDAIAVLGIRAGVVVVVHGRSGAVTFDRRQQPAVMDERASIRFASKVQRHLRSVPI